MAEKIIGSKMPSENGYGQNGYGGASSDTDLKNPTRAPLAVELFPGGDSLKGLLGDDKAAVKAPMTRTVSADLQPLSFGMAQRSPRT